MNYKTLTLFLVALALGGWASNYFLSQLPVVGADKTSAAAKKPERPDWMAPPGSERALDASQVVAKAAPKQKQRLLKVGVIGPETGEGAVYGLSVVHGVQLAAERFNALGGIDGKKFEVLHFDNQGGDALTREIFTDLARKGVMAVFSAPTGWSTFAPVHIANSTKTIMVSVGARRNIGRSGAYVLQYSLPDDVAITDLLSYSINELGYKNYALVTSSANDYSLSISAHFKQVLSKLGGTIGVDADTYNSFTGGQDIPVVVKALENAAKPLQAMIFTGDAAEASQLLHAVAEAGLKLPLLGGEDLFSDEFLKKSGAAGRGALLYVTFAPDGKTPQVAEFLKRYGKIQKGTPNRFAALAYDAFTNLADAVKASGSLESAKVRDAILAGKEANGVTGSTTWTPEGVSIKHPFLYRIEADGSGEKFVLVRNGAH